MDTTQWFMVLSYNGLLLGHSDCDAALFLLNCSGIAAKSGLESTIFKEMVLAIWFTMFFGGSFLGMPSTLGEIGFQNVDLASQM